MTKINCDLIIGTSILLHRRTHLHSLDASVHGAALTRDINEDCFTTYATILDCSFFWFQSYGSR